VWFAKIETLALSIDPLAESAAGSRMLTAFVVLLRSIGLMCRGHRVAGARESGAASATGHVDPQQATAASHQRSTLLDPTRQILAELAQRLIVVQPHVRLHGGMAPVRRFLPNLIDLVLNGQIAPGKVFDLTLPLEQVAEGYRAMDERRAITTLPRP
jgi:hypothetical protein